jgi:hypothetical protein
LREIFLRLVFVFFVRFRGYFGSLAVILIKIQSGQSGQEAAAT